MPKKSKLDLVQKGSMVGKIGLRIGFRHALKPPQGNFQAITRKKHFSPSASRPKKYVMVPHWEKSQN